VWLFSLNIKRVLHSFYLRRLVLLLLPRRLELRRVLLLRRLFLLLVLDPPFNIPRFFRISITRCFTASDVIVKFPDFISDAIASSM
jgi:hypothetical protein